MDAIIELLDGSVDIVGIELPYSAVFVVIALSFILASVGIGYVISQMLEEAAWNKANSLVLEKVQNIGIF